MKLRHYSSFELLRGSRALSLMLLAFVIFGSTVEAAHTHGNLLAANSVNDAAHFSDPADQGKLNTSSTGCGECLICQLHQHFQSSVVTAPCSISPVTQTNLFVSSHAVLPHSQIVVTRIGRAPPTISC